MSQTLTYTIGADKRALVSDVQDFHIDFTSDNSNWVQARQYEDSMRQVFVNVKNQDGTPYNLTGTNIWFEGVLPDKTHKILDSNHAVILDATNGQFRFDMPKQAFAVAGSYQQAFFRIVRDGASVTTLEFDLEVLADKVIGGLVPKDWIGPFEEIAGQLVDDLQKHTDSADKIIADFQQKVTDLVNQLNQQGSTTTSMLVELQNRITALETQIKQDGLITQGQMDKLLGALSDFKMPGTTVADKINGEFQGRGVNVKWFGAVGDGTTDDTAAVKAAIDACKNYNNESDGEHSYHHYTVYFPIGKYYISGTNILIANVSLEGLSKYDSIILSNQSDPTFTLGMHSSVENLGFEDTSTSNMDNHTTKMIGVDKTLSSSAFFDIRLRHLFFRGQEAVTGPSGSPTSGIWVLDCIYLELDNRGMWDIDIDDISCNYVHSGLTINTKNGGWLTGSHFNNILVRGISGWHTAVVSDNNTARQVSQCVFSNLTAEIVYKTATNAIGYIVSGCGNEWQNLMLFNDGAYSGHAIQLNYFGASDQKYPNFSSGSSANNIFQNGTLEGDIDDPKNLRELQIFKNLRLQLKDSNGNVQQQVLQSSYRPNLISDDTIKKMLDKQSMVYVAKTASANTGYDNYGKYLEIKTGADRTSWDIILTEPDRTIWALNNSDFSLGVRFRKMTDSSDLVNATACLNGVAVPQGDLVGLFKSTEGGTSDTSNTIQYSWIYKNDPSYQSQLTSYQPMDRITFYVDANSTIRFYDAFLTAGRTIDFSKISRPNTTNKQHFAGGQNYVQNGNSNWLRSDNPVSNQAAVVQAYTISANDFQWLRGKEIVISFDASITSYDATNVAGRYCVSADLNVKFTDGTTFSASAGVPNYNQSLVLGRYQFYTKLPQKNISSVNLMTNIRQGFSASSYNIGRPQVESGTEAGDYVSYTASTD